MPASKARPILIFTAVLAAVPALAQIAPSPATGIARTVATTRIDQPATLTNSQDLAFVVQTPVAAALGLGQATTSTARVTTSGASSGTAAAARGASAPTAPSPPAAAPAAAPTTSELVRGAAATVSAAVPTAAQATFTVAGDGGQAISVTVPPTVDLARDGGVETALLTTTNNLAEGPQFLGGNFAGGGTLSFAVGGQITLASSTSVSSGTYNGLLAVVAQYN